MELDDLKNEWKEAGKTSVETARLRSMTSISSHPQLRRIRLKLIIETIAIALFLSFYYDFFDGELRPSWAHILLVSGTVLFLLNDVIGYIALIQPSHGSNLSEALSKLLTRVRLMAAGSMITTLIFGAVLVLYFSSSIVLNDQKKWMVVGMLVIFGLQLIQLYRFWTSRIRGVRGIMRDFEE